jgi:hypothetical protein
MFVSMCNVNAAGFLRILQASEMETGKWVVFGGAATQHIHFSVILPFSIEEEGIRG